MGIDTSGLLTSNNCCSTSPREHDNDDDRQCAGNKAHLFYERFFERKLKNGARLILSVKHIAYYYNTNTGIEITNITLFNDQRTDRPRTVGWTE